MKTRIVRSVALLGAVVVATAGCTWFQRVSATTATDKVGVQDRPVLSTDGRYVAYTAPDASGTVDQVYRLDTTNGTRTLISVGAGGAAADDSSGEPAISGDGRYVAFSSDATNLVAGDQNDSTDVFVRDLVAGTTTRVSLAPGGVELNDPTTTPAISADGRYVAFVTESDDLDPKDTNGGADVYELDRTTGGLTLVSLVNGVQPDFGVSQLAMSGNGHVIAFTTDTDMLPGDQNLSDDVYVKDLVARSAVRVTRPKNGVPEDGGGSDPSLSFDGRYVAFSGAGDIDGVATTTPGTQVFVRDTSGSTVTRISTTDAGTPIAGNSGDPVLSSDGRRIVYTSTASPVTDANGAVADVFVKDLDRNRTRVVSTDWLLNQRPAPAFAGAISPDGHYAAFTSAGQFASDDTNSVVDAYVRAVDVPTITTITPTSAARGSTVTFTVNGTGFIPGAAGISIDNLFTATGATYVSDSRVTVTLKIAANAATGPTNFYVVNPGTGPGLTTGALSRCENCLTIT